MSVDPTTENLLNVNFMARVEAVINDVTQGQYSQQAADAVSEQNETQIEQNIYSYYNSILDSDMSKINADGTNQSQLAIDQAQFNEDQTKMQNAANGADTQVQSIQTQLNNDSSNLQTLLQLGTSVNSIGSQLSTLLSH